MKIEDFILEARKGWEVKPPLDPPDGIRIEIGGGNRPQPMVNRQLELPDWNADVDDIPYLDETVACIYMYGVLDYVVRPVRLLQEFERVLITGGVVNLVVPHAMSELGVSDIHKRTFWTERSFRNLLNNPYYDPEGWNLELEVYTQFIFALDWRYLSVFAQLRRL